MFSRSTWIVQQNKLLSRCAFLILPKRGTFKSVSRPKFENMKNIDASKQLDMSVQISHRIKMTGAITVAEYMKNVLTNPCGGYYMNKDVFGERGDFITSPELTQLFGEMLAIWLVMEWQKLGSPTPFQIVELGPGKGSLMADILRVFRKLGIKSEECSVHLVEVSPTLRQLQVDRLCLSHKSSTSAEHTYEGEGIFGNEMLWYEDLEKVPKGFTFIIAHEFLDSLPIHKFQKTDKGWRELLIDIDREKSSETDTKFRYVIAPDDTTATKLFANVFNNELDQCEICPQALKIVQELASRVNKNGGIALLVDYGHDGSKGDTFRAFKNHQQVDPLENLGHADLTADVNFKLLKEVAKEARVFGPVSQRNFLQSIRADIRLKILLENATKEQQESLQSGYDMLTSPDKMGDCFKFMALFPTVNDEHYEKLPVFGFDAK